MRALRLAGKEKYSTVDGPGLRYVIFFQGCRHNCPGCHNPETHSFEEGKEAVVEKLVEDILNTPGISGVTISGGDPFFQYVHLLHLCQLIKEKTTLNIWVYTGFSEEDVLALFPDIVYYVDALVVGPYLQEQRTLSVPFVGSVNQKIVLLSSGVITHRKEEIWCDKN